MLVFKKLMNQGTTNNNSIVSETVAIPVDKGVLSAHFGHADIFSVFHIANGIIVKNEDIKPPAHEPGIIPKWLQEVGVTVVIAGGIGQGAINMLSQYNIVVLASAPTISSEQIIKKYVNKELTIAGGTCNHDHPHDHACDQ